MAAKKKAKGRTRRGRAPARRQASARKGPARPAKGSRARRAAAPARPGGGAPASGKNAGMAFTVRFASTDEDRDLAFALRRKVFEEEQGVPRPLDRDAHDLNADHVVVFDGGGRCVGTGRAVRVDNRVCQVGRMATAEDQRGKGVGGMVLDYLERMASLRGLKEIVVHAQLPAESFYRKRGYVTETPTFLEEGVPHVRMRKMLVQ